MSVALSGIGSPEAGIIGSYENPMSVVETEFGPPQEHWDILSTAEPLLQALS